MSVPRLSWVLCKGDSQQCYFSFEKGSGMQRVAKNLVEEG
jgi:hypothetical protein